MADALGTVRDLDVRLAWLHGVREVAPEIEHAGLDFLIERAERARERARGPMVALLERLVAEDYRGEFLDFILRGVRRG